MNKFDLDYNSCDNEGNTYLHNAACAGMTDVCKLLLHTMNKETINTTNKKGESILHLAIDGKYTEVVEFIINN